MKTYPFRVTVPAGAPNHTSYENVGAQSYLRTIQEAETRALTLLRQGADIVKVTYLGHILALLNQRDLGEIIEGDESTFIINRTLRPAIEKLGDVQPLPQGKRKREALSLIEIHIPDEQRARQLFDALRPYLK